MSLLAYSLAACGAANETTKSCRLASARADVIKPSKSLPNSGFEAYYFDRSQPGKVIARERVDNIAIKFGPDNLYGIAPRDFGAYWVGVRTFPESTTQKISVSQSWAVSCITIDGKPVFDKENDQGSFMHTFSAGEHMIEVDYLNNWHTVEYKATLEPDTGMRSSAEMKEALVQAQAEGAKLYYAGIYESKNRDATVAVNVPSVGRPVVVWLSSYEAIDWKITSSDKIAAVVVNAHAPGSRVSGVDPQQIFHTKERIKVRNETRRCACNSGYFHCEDDKDLLDAADQIRRVTGMPLEGYATAYSTGDLTMTPFDDRVRDRISNSRRDIEAVQKTCPSPTGSLL